MDKQGERDEKIEGKWKRMKRSGMQWQGKRKGATRTRERPVVGEEEGDKNKRRVSLGEEEGGDKNKVKGNDRGRGRRLQEQGKGQW